MGDPLLEVENLTVGFRTEVGVVTAVRDVTFEVHPGEVVAVVGESGSGKSVMALSILGLHPETAAVSGRIGFAGRDLVKESPHTLRSIRGSEIAMIFQDPMTALNPLMTVGEQVAEAIQVHRAIGRDEAFAMATELLHRVGIPEVPRRIHQYPHEFSGGMCQRVMIAMAIANEPKLLIADEPTTALDVTVQAQVMEVMRDIRQQTGAAMILITHDLGLVAGTADRALVMYGGRILESGSVSDIFFRTRNPYTRGLMRSIPRRAGRGLPLTPIPGSPPSLLEMPTGCPFVPRCELAELRCTQGVPPLVPVESTTPNGTQPHHTRCFRQHELTPWNLEVDA